MISWLELNHPNAFVKIATDELMLYIKSWKNVLKRFVERWFNPQTTIPPACFKEVFISKNGSFMTI